MIKAYVLIGCSPGGAKSVSDALAVGKANSGESRVSEAVTVTGEYDVIATVEASNLDEVTNLILSGIQRVEGVVRTTTCLAVKLGGA